MPSPSSLALCISAALAPWSATLAADDNTLTPVVVSATREATEASQASRQVAVVDRQALDSQQPDSVADALKYQGNVEVGGGSRPGAQTPVLRGLSGTRVLQVIDGVRQNTNSGHRGTYFVDPELIQQIEVVKGPASALWGSGALGGVVAVQTRNARDLLAAGEQVGGHVRQGFHSADDKSLTSGALYGQQGQHDWLVSGYYHDSNNLRLGNGQDLTYSAARQQGVMGKYGWQPDDAQRLSLSVRHSQSDQNAPSNPASEVSSSVPLVEQATRDFNTTLDYRLNPADNPWLDSRVTAYLNRTHFDEYRIEKQQQDDIDYQTLGLNGSNRASLGWANLLGGADIYLDKTWGSREGSSRPIPADGRSRVWGAYLQAEVPFLTRWQLTPGVRYDNFHTEDKQQADSARSQDHLSPSVGLTWFTTRWLTLNARYDEAFRAPTSEEMFTSGTHFCLGSFACNRFQPNPDLKAETARNKEIGARLNFEHLLADDQLELSANLFRNDISNYIELQVINDFSTMTFESNYANVTRARISGYELAADYRWRLLGLNLSYSQAKGEDKTQGDALADIPASKLVFGISQGLLDGDVRLGSRLSWYRDQDRVPSSSSTQGYDGYTLWDLTASWRPQQGDWRNWQLDFALDNVTDEYYLPAFSELYAPGRNAKLAVGYRF